jgi:hypothetical protein
MNRALLVGINKYQLPNCNLQGCVNDVTNVRDILLNYVGFQVEDIRVLTDERATKAAIIERLHWLKEGTQSGDRIFFQQSSHGSQIRDRGKLDELKDHMDEIICPYDMNWDKGTWISDDDIHEIFKDLPHGVILEIILDSCHSGTMLKGLSMFNLFAFDRRARYLPPPVDLQMRFDGITEELTKKKLFEEEKSIIGASKILYAACRDWQTAADTYIDGQYCGAFTCYWCKHIRNSNGEIARNKLMSRVNSSLRYNQYDQIAMLYASQPNRKLGLFNTIIT